MHELISDHDFYLQNGYGWDYCIVFKTEKNKKNKPKVSDNSKEMIKKICQTGLEVYCYLSPKKDSLFCLIRGNLDLIRAYASDTGRMMELDPEQTKNRAESGFPVFPVGAEKKDQIVKPFFLNDDQMFSVFHPYSHIFAAYNSRETIENLYKWSPGMSHPFHGVIRLELIRELLRERKANGGADINIDQEIINKDTIKAEFPLHHPKLKKLLIKDWVKLCQWPLSQPFEEIKDYFGEKIGLYFLFLGHYTKWLFFLTAVGFGCNFISNMHHNHSDPSVMFFALFVSLWAVIWLETWKRLESTTALKWGTTNVEAVEQIRPSFLKNKNLETIHSPVTGEEEKHYPVSAWYKAQLLSLSVISMCILVVLAAVIAVFSFRYYLVNVKGFAYGSYVGSGLNSLQILLFNIVYSKIAVKMTDLENHKTDTEYEDHLIGKLFMFQLVNSYSSFFYIAFIQTVQGVDCEGGKDCMQLLHDNLAILFLTQILVGNFKEVALPWIVSKYNERRQLSGTKDITLSQAEQEFLLERYDVLMGPLEDYEELAIQFGYLTLFVSSWPLIPLFGLLSNLIEIRSDSYKLLHGLQRPVPVRVQDIGTWYTVFKAVASFAVVTNAALMVFVMESRIKQLPIHLQIWIFLIIQYVIFGTQAIVAYLIPDVPADVLLQLQRQDNLVKKLIHQEPDANDEVHRSSSSV